MTGKVDILEPLIKSGFSYICSMDEQIINVDSGHWMQPEGEGSCGQHAIANLLGVDIEKSYCIFGHHHGTRTSELVKAAEILGYKCPHKRLKKIPGDRSLLPDMCVLKMHFSDCKQTHWVAYKHGIIYDSNVLYGYNEASIKAKGIARITSYLTIEK